MEPKQYHLIASCLLGIVKGKACANLSIGFAFLLIDAGLSTKNGENIRSIKMSAMTKPENSE